MEIQQQFRTSNSQTEIVDALFEMHVSEIPVLIWQNDSGERNVTKARISSIDLMTSAIVLKPFQEKDFKNFERLNSNLTLYFKGETKNIVFKQDQSLKLISRDLARVEIPKEVKLQEKREEIRVLFDNHFSKITVDIYSGGRTDKSIRPMSAELRDISVSGLGISLAKKHSRLFYEKDKVKIDRIGNYRFPRPIYGTIIYLVDGSSSFGHAMIGVRFNEKIDPEILDRIK